MSANLKKPVDYGLDHLAAIAFNQSQQKNNYYNGQDNKPIQTALLDTYENEIVPLLQDNHSLRIENEDLQLADMVGDFGILNRKAIDSRLQKMATRIIMGNLTELDGLAVAYADIDSLKMINGVGGADKGHDMGDAAIVNAAEQLSRVRPDHDIVARLGGGDEFGILMLASSEKEAHKLMIGTTKRPGYIPRSQKLIDDGRRELKRHYGTRWVKDLPDKKPGNVSMGWTFLSRERFVALYKEWLQDKQNKKPGVGDFSTYVFGGADKEMFRNKI